MADINQLKYQARREEQRNNWSRAIELYSRALEKSEETLEIAPDVSLYNRIGDLHLRQNDTEEAISFYLQAVDRYAEQGLHPGAIALCNKILRVSPSRVDVHRKLGRLHVATGLLAEARASFREYATRMEERGEADRRLDALFELATLTEDEDLHLDLVEELADQGREEEAAERLLELVELRIERGEEVDGLRRRVLELDPSAEVPGAGEPAVEMAGDGAPETGVATEQEDAGAAPTEEREEAGEREETEDAEAAEAASPEPTGEKTIDTSALGYGSVDLDESSEKVQAEADEEIRGLFEEMEAGADEDAVPPPGKAEVEEDEEDEAEVSLRYAQVLQRNGQTDEAIEQLEETLRSLLGKDAREQALPVAERLVELDPGNAPAREVLGPGVGGEEDAATAEAAEEAAGEEAGEDEEVVPFSVSEKVGSEGEEPEPPRDSPAETAGADAGASGEKMPDFTGMLQNMGWLGADEEESEEATDEEEREEDESASS